MDDDFCMAAWRSKSPNYTYTFPWVLVVGKVSDERETGQLRLPFRLGSRHFELLITRSHFPDLLFTLQDGYTAEIQTKVDSLIQLKVRDRLLARIEELGTSVKSYRQVWLVRYDRIEDTLLEIWPGSTIGLSLGPSVDMPEFPSFSWNEIQVLCPVAPDRYKVKVWGTIFECYTPRHNDIFSEEIHLWREIACCPETYSIRAPKLKGLVRTDRYNPRLRGILYDWIEPWKEARNLSDVIVGQVSRQQREIWYEQVACSIDAVHRLGLRCTCQGRKPWRSDVQNITIDGDLNANFSMIAFGSWHVATDEEVIKSGGRKRWKLDTKPEPDIAFLEFFRKFLQIEPRRRIVQSSSNQSNREATRSNLDALSPEIRNMIYGHLLEDDDPVLYRHGEFFRQIPRSSKLWAKSLRSESPIPGEALFLVSKGMRRESLSFFVSNNQFYVEAVEICRFLQNLGPYAKLLKRITIVIVLSDVDSLSQAQSTGISELQQKATSLRAVNTTVCNTTENCWRWQRPILALQEFRGLEEFEVTLKSGNLSARDRKDIEACIRPKVLNVSSLA